MEWVEQASTTRENIKVSVDKAKSLNETRKDLPVIQEEAAKGVRPFQSVAFQPIQGVNTFEAEFTAKGDDLIFHFWPWGYHGADRAGSPRLPTFPKTFESVLKDVFAKTFPHSPTIEREYDADVGAWFVRVVNGATNHFHFQLCVKAASDLHVALGGTLEQG